MSVDNYSELQSHIADTVNRTDLSSSVTDYSPSALDSVIIRSISLAEQKIVPDIMARGGISHMETLDDSVDTVAGQEHVTLPDGFVGMRSLSITTNPYQLLTGYGDINSLFNQYPSTTQSKPQAYAVVGADKIYLRPVPDSAYDLRIIYYKTLPVLSATNTSNWLLTYGLGVYTNAAMTELCMYLGDYQAAQIWESFYEKKLSDLLKEDKSARFGLVPQKASVQVSIA